MSKDANPADPLGPVGFMHQPLSKEPQPLFPADRLVARPEIVITRIRSTKTVIDIEAVALLVEPAQRGSHPEKGQINPSTGQDFLGNPRKESAQGVLLPGDRRGIRGRSFAALEREKFLSIDRDVARCLDAKANLAAVDIHDGDADVIPDENLFTEFTTQDQHLATLLPAKQWLTCFSTLPHLPDRGRQRSHFFASLPEDYPE